LSAPDLLIDADMYLFQAAQACEVETDWGNDHWTLHSDAGAVRRMFAETIDVFREALGGGKPILCFSDPSRRSFRHDLTETYKQGRKKTRKPLAYAAVRDQLADTYKTIIKPRLEADDVMGIVATRAPGKFIIVSGDKDMHSIPGLLYRQGELTEVSEWEANRFHLMQTLTGDVTDGYPGCPGIGPVKAEKILHDWVTKTATKHPNKAAWAGVVDTFKRAGKTEEDALLQARLARILRCTEWDFDKSEVKLWTP
jgi:DNA polymerase-1